MSSTCFPPTDGQVACAEQKKKIKKKFSRTCSPNSNIPDIDKWNLWERDITREIKQVDYAFLDGTFYQNGEIWGRYMSQIPHPFIVESMAQFAELPTFECGKAHFIHINHTNPLLQEGETARKEVESNGFGLAEEMQIFEL